MNQYADRPKVAALLRDTSKDNSHVKVANGMVELIIDGERAVVPTMEAFAKLAAKASNMEQRLIALENKINRVRRTE